jgi:hypothetical protein
LGKDGQSLPAAIFSDFLTAVTGLVRDFGGLLGFSHECLRNIVEDRYLADAKERRAAHLVVADYFMACDASSLRRVDEMAWQLAEAGAWQRLGELLSDLDYFVFAWKVNPFDVKAFWKQVEESSDLRMLETYSTILSDPQRYEADEVWQLAMLITETDHLDEAVALEQWLIERFRRSGDLAKLQASLANQAQILLTRGERDRALALLKEQEGICRQLANHECLMTALGNQALILTDCGGFDHALVLWKEHEQLSLELGKRDELARSMGKQARVLFTSEAISKGHCRFINPRRLSSRKATGSMLSQLV